MNTCGWYDVKEWILSFGADAKLLEPADKRKDRRNPQADGHFMQIKE